MNTKKLATFGLTALALAGCASTPVMNEEPRNERLVSKNDILKAKGNPDRVIVDGDRIGLVYDKNTFFYTPTESNFYTQK